MPPPKDPEQTRVEQKLREAVEDWREFERNRKQRLVEGMSPEQRRAMIRMWTKAITKTLPAIGFFWTLNKLRNPQDAVMVSSMAALVIAAIISAQSEDDLTLLPPGDTPSLPLPGFHPELEAEDVISAVGEIQSQVDDEETDEVAPAPDESLSPESPGPGPSPEMPVSVAPVIELPEVTEPEQEPEQTEPEPGNEPEPEPEPTDEPEPEPPDPPGGGGGDDAPPDPCLIGLEVDELLRVCVDVDLFGSNPELT